MVVALYVVSQCHSYKYLVVINVKNVKWRPPIFLEKGSELRLSLNVLLHKQMLTVEDGVGELPYPVAENHHTGSL